ncbi:MAG: WD40/YVTN/BNR-like repeat-containing protein [Desulfococcaceae bacterium]
MGKRKWSLRLNYFGCYSQLNTLLPDSRIIILCVMVFMVAAACINDRWKYVCQYPYLHEANDIWFTGNTGLFAGWYMNLDNMNVKDIIDNRWTLREAVILKTKLNAHDNWIKTYSGNGEILQLLPVDNVTFLSLGRKYDANGKAKAFLLISNDTGQTWKMLPEPPDLFDGIACYKDNTVYGWAGESVFVSKDIGVNWICINGNLSINNSEAKPIVDDKGILWLVSKGRIVGLSADGTKQDEEVKEKIKIDCFANSQEGTLWVIGRGGKNFAENVLLIKKEAAHVYKVVSKLPYFLPRDLWVGHGVINVWGSDMNESPPTRLLMISSDRGLSWSQEKPKDIYAHGPVFFENDQIIWNVATKDRIQRRGVR